MTGEGSHFGTGGTGTDSAGYSLGKDSEGGGFSAAEPTTNTDSSGYAIAKDAENLGAIDEGNHVNTAATPSALGEDDGTGRATIGETSTYSSHPLSTGDKTSSVIDPTSSDANTFRRPEVPSSAGVGPHAAETAARRAMDPSSEHMPGGYPEESSNPYASSSLDPRVDSAGHAPVMQSHTGRDAALGAGAGAAGIGAYEATKTHEPASSTSVTPSTLMSNTNPTERSPAYGSANESRALDSAAPATTATPATTSTPAVTTAGEPTEKKGMVGTVLGALGLGGGAAAAKHEHDKDSAVDSAPSTTTGLGSYRTPSQSGPPPSHHRKESIPTTAYPSGSLDSVRPSAGPTGQTPTSDRSLGRDAAIGAGGLGAAGLGAHEYEKSRQPITGAGDSTVTSGIAGTSSAVPNTSTVHDLVTGSAPQTSQATADSSQHVGSDAVAGGAAVGAAGLGAHEFEKSKAPGVSSGVTPTSQQYGNQTIETAQTSQPATGDSHHFGRDAAIGGGAVGAAGLGAHEYEKNKESAAATSGATTSSQQYGSQPIASQDDAKNFSDQVDPRTDAAGNPRSGTGVAAVPAGSSSQPEDQHHYGRDAAMVGGGAAASGIAANEFSEHDAEKAEKEHAKLQKQQTKETEKEEKAHAKEIKREQKAEEKAEKKHEKAVAKEEKKEEKTAAKEEKREEKAAAKDHKRHEEEGAAAVGAGALGAGAYEAEHHQSSTSGGGLAAADAADAEAYNKKNRYTAAMADPGADPTVRKPSIASGGGTAGARAVGAGEHHGQGTTQGTHGSDPYYNRHQVPDSAIPGQQIDSTAAPGAAAVGGTTYEAEKHHDHSTGHKSGLAAADEDDRRAYGQSHEKEKKPSLFKRIFKRKKNTHTGESEDDEDNYEDVPHDHTSSSGGSPATAAGTTQPHGEGEFSKPSYNPFKKEDPNVKPVEGRIRGAEVV